MVDTHQIKGLGYIPDLYNFRDFTPNHKDVAKIYSSISGLKTSLKAGAQKDTMPISFDIRKDFTPIMDQQHLGSCTAHAGAGLVQYFEKKAFGSYTDASRRFIYKVTRNILHFSGD